MKRSQNENRWVGNPYLDQVELAAHAPAFDFDAVEEALVDAFVLWRRTPGEGRWPFASDGPWHLVQRSTMAGDYDARGGDLDEEIEASPLPLTREEVERRDRVTGWIDLVPDAEDRRLIGMALRALAGGADRVPWKRIMKQMGLTRGRDGLRKRYSRAITVICQTLNARTC